MNCDKTARVFFEELVTRFGLSNLFVLLFSKPTTISLILSEASVDDPRLKVVGGFKAVNTEALEGVVEGDAEDLGDANSAFSPI